MRQAVPEGAQKSKLQLYLVSLTWHCPLIYQFTNNTHIIMLLNKTLQNFDGSTIKHISHKHYIQCSNLKTFRLETCK